MSSTTDSVVTPEPVTMTLEAYGKTFPILRKPPVLMVAELARVESGEPEAIAVLAEFFEVTLGPETYRDFKRAAYASEDDGEIMAAMARVIEVTSSVPTP